MFAVKICAKYLYKQSYSVVAYVALSLHFWLFNEKILASTIAKCSVILLGSGVGGGGAGNFGLVKIRAKSFKIRAKSVEIWTKCVKTFAKSLDVL